MDQDIEAPPMGGENLPGKELSPDKPDIVKIKKEKAKNKYLKLFLIIGVVLALSGGILLGFLISQSLKPKTQPSPSPVLLSPSPEASPPLQPYTLEQRMDNFKELLDETDLKETSLIPPNIDYKIRFKVED